MRTILLDHLRRWWWLWLLSCVGCGYIVGFGRPLKPDLSNAWFPLAMYLGVVQLSGDLRRGDIPRALRAMPVSAKDIGRAWWWASVGVPVLALALITGLVCLLSPLLGGRPVPALPCFYYWLSNALLFGPLFFFMSGLVPMSGPRGGAEAARGCLFSLLFVATAFLMLYFYWLFPPPTLRWKVFVVVSFLLTVAGWFRAERYAREQVGRVVRFRPRVVPPMPWTPFGRVKPSRCAEGYGGLRLLFQTVFNRMLLLGLFCVALGAAVMVPAQRLTEALSKTPLMVNATTVIFTTQILFWLICWQAIRTALHTRFLRTLPVTATRVAAVLILAPVTAMLAVLAFAGLVFALLFPAAELSPLKMVHGGCFLQIALAALVVPFVVWRGFDLAGFLAVALVMMGVPVGMMVAGKHLSLAMNLVLPVVLILGCFWVTRLLLERSRAAYRPRYNQFGDSQWGRLTVTHEPRPASLP